MTSAAGCGAGALVSAAGLAVGAVATGVTVATGLLAGVEVVSAGLAGAGSGVGAGAGSVFALDTGASAGLESVLDEANRGVVDEVLSSPGELTSLAVALALAAIRGTFSFTGEADIAEESPGGGASPDGSTGDAPPPKPRAISSNVRPFVSGTRKYVKMKNKMRKAMKMMKT